MSGVKKSFQKYRNEKMIWVTSTALLIGSINVEKDRPFLGSVDSWPLHYGMIRNRHEELLDEEGAER